jgi:hypothetical protein
MLLRIDFSLQGRLLALGYGSNSDIVQFAIRIGAKIRNCRKLS